MPNKQDVTQCIQTCTKAANDLRSSANGINNAGVRDVRQGTVPAVAYML